MSDAPNPMAKASAVAITIGAAAVALPYLATGDERCLVLRLGDCRWWWLP